VTVEAPPSRWERLPANVQGAAWLAASAIASAAMLMAAKGLEDRISSYQIVFVRAFASFVLVAGLIPRLGWEGLKPTRPLLLVARSALATIALVLLFHSVATIPLADAQALNFANVVFIIPLSALILAERIGWRRWTAAVVGFLGVLIVLKPGFSSSHVAFWGALAGVGGAAAYAAMLITVRMVSRTMHADATYVWGIVGLAFMSLPLALLDWTWPTAEEWLHLAGVAALGAVGQYAAVRAFAVGEASAIAPVDYLKLVFALIGGALFFHELPDAATMVGALVIVGATAYATWREARVRKDRAASAVPPADAPP
jgi:drug/metabolite transporter (DMT)-like permease